MTIHKITPTPDRPTNPTLTVTSDKTDTPTPRTTAQVRRIDIENEDSCCAIYVKVDGKDYEGDLVDADFARQLERELAAMQEDRDRMVGYINADREEHGRWRKEADAQTLAIAAERDQLRADVERATALNGECATALRWAHTLTDTLERELASLERSYDYAKAELGRLVADVRRLGAAIPCNTGGTFQNDPPDAIIDAAIRALKTRAELITHKDDQLHRENNQVLSLRAELAAAHAQAKRYAVEARQLAAQVSMLRDSLDVIEGAVRDAKMADAVREAAYRRKEEKP